MTGTTESVARRGAGAPNAVKRGELRIYLGAAPGVGKTYTMLGEAYRRLERGTDVVAAVVEAHSREKTAELLEGIQPLGISKGTTGYRRAGVDRIKVDCRRCGRDGRCRPARAGAGQPDRQHAAVRTRQRGSRRRGRGRRSHPHQPRRRRTGYSARHRGADLEPFQHLGDPDTRGVGLGMSVARGFVEAMGDTIAATDIPGGALTVQVDLAAPKTGARR